MKRVYIILAVILTSLFLVLFFASYFHSKSKKTSDLVCNSNIITQASNYLKTPVDINNLNKLTKKIQTNLKYQNDINCLYIITAYYVDLSDASNAKHYYTLLSQGNNSSVNSKLIEASGMNINVLNNNVDFLQHENKFHGTGVKVGA